MPLFFIVTIATATILLGATAADGRWWQSSHATVALSFDPSPYRLLPQQSIEAAAESARPISALVAAVGVARTCPAARPDMFNIEQPICCPGTKRW
jgi:hypothetical protein